MKRNAYLQSGNSPTSSPVPHSLPDFTLDNHGSIFLLKPHTIPAKEWISQYVSREGYQPYWPTVVIEPRYVGDIVAGIEADGFVIGGGQ